MSRIHLLYCEAHLARTGGPDVYPQAQLSPPQALANVSWGMQGNFSGADNIHNIPVHSEISGDFPMVLLPSSYNVRAEAQFPFPDCEAHLAWIGIDVPDVLPQAQLSPPQALANASWGQQENHSEADNIDNIPAHF